MAEPNRDTSGSQDIIDDALRLVDALQRKLITEGVRRGVNSATAPPSNKDDVWSEAIRREQPQPDPPPLDQLMGVVRTAGPQVVGHLGRAGATLAGAVGESLGIIERTMREKADEARRAGEPGEEPEPEPPKPISRGE
ncbi:hypothetical protein F4561_001653 [Lipingzhangella halophila]|uniref:Uncharacterized protein n=1 Tax=Lipingzhangella halophila TaxID=1783352 RepID=A0A7W7RFR1_9ACTN|nr:hypothetical protein [Lipingzhangella halophila]MBB4930833.1 hypothetical protein [Lipingzhangella halophila]